MKKMRAAVIYELEVPDDWQLVSPCAEEDKILMIDGKFYQPEMIWMEFKRKNPDGTIEYEQADEDASELIFDHAKSQMEASIKLIKRSKAGKHDKE